MQLTIAKTTEDLQKTLVDLAKAGKRIGLVPTMGALHGGHVACMKLAKEHADAVVATIFVNPKQFGANEDFGKYPRMIEADIEKIREAGASLVYIPEASDIYPADFTTSVSVGELGKILEGASRPGFFEGVATVLTKLFLRILPHVAIFGEKDYQQLCVVRRLVADLDLPIDIIGAPTVRERDGLAMSSRNAYLSADERRIAPKLHEILQNVGSMIAGGSAVKAALEQGTAALAKAGFKPDYLELRNAETFEPLTKFKASARLLAAAWLGKTRLIDNIAVE